MTYPTYVFRVRWQNFLADTCEKTLYVPAYDQKQAEMLLASTMRYFYTSGEYEILERSVMHEKQKRQKRRG